ncbi:hypothetical protein KASIA_p040 [Shewanella phage vB_SspS_KASIA]|nr:hypothetical protein KASIA_p040 [Shewanella phage vB_SspS_KASIA]
MMWTNMVNKLSGLFSKNITDTSEKDVIVIHPTEDVQTFCEVGMSAESDTWDEIGANFLKAYKLNHRRFKIYLNSSIAYDYNGTGLFLFILVDKITKKRFEVTFSKKRDGSFCGINVLHSKDGNQYLCKFSEEILNGIIFEVRELVCARKSKFESVREKRLRTLLTRSLKSW